jgi:predicted lipid-binding transport protein (Tim44 family)
VVFKLRSVLGTRSGAQRPPYTPPAQNPPGAQNPAAAASNVVAMPGVAKGAPRPGAAPDPSPRWKGFAEPGSALYQGFDEIAGADRNFSPQDFLGGARSAYEMIVAAFAAADLDALRRLLAADAYDNFEKAITARVNAGQTMTTTLVSLDGADIVEARLAGKNEQVSVRFAAKLVSVTRDQHGAEVEGSSSDVVDHLDIWTFTRDVGARDPNWALAATQTVH